MITRVSDTEHDGSSLFMTIGKTNVRLIKASYGDKVEKGDVQEMGTQAISAVTPGTYKPENMKVTMRNSVWRAVFMPRLPIQGASNTPLSIVISYINPDVGSDSDRAAPAFYVGSSISPDNTNKGVDVDVEFKVQQYYWTDKRTTKNSVVGAFAIGITLF